MKNLDTLNQIPFYGRRHFQGNTYSIKWRYNTEEASQLFRVLFANVPYLKGSLLSHTTASQKHIILGGTFDKNSGVYEAWQKFNIMKKVKKA